MIEINNVTKQFDKRRAIDDLSIRIRDGEVFGLVGTNGAGKTTLLRMLCGILQPDEGTLAIDGQEIFDNPLAKKQFFLIPDEPFFFSNSRARTMADYFAGIYESFSMERFELMLKDFNLDPALKLSGYSKGMLKQLYIIYGLCAGTKYLFCDETFDGLDPLMRQATKSLFAKEMVDRGLTPILTSHSLRELEDICDTVCLLHGGKLLFEKTMDELAGKSLEQFFIEETEAQGYDISNITQG